MRSLDVQSNFRQKCVRGMFGVVGGFIILFGLRLAYGYTTHPTDQQLSSTGVTTPNFQLNRHNYASSKAASKGARKGASGVVSVDQKYERIADTSLSTSAFADDETKLRDAIGEQRGLIQFEQKSGLAGHRSLHLAIGVAPERFDALVKALSETGRVERLQIHKVDKTNDYKELQAQRSALQKTRAALVALKGNGGKLNELMTLEDSILKTEERIQGLGISLGDFDEENEFCTVKVSLRERGAPVASVPFFQRAKVAFEWTLGRYLELLGIAFLGSLLVLVALALLQRLGAIRAMLRAIVESTAPDKPVVSP